jgi:hypothetical protein
MNNLIVDIIPLKVDRLLIESSIKSGGPLMVEGIIQRAGVKNHNGRIYEREILEREMEKYMEGPIASNNALGELDHPDSSVINLNNVSHKINKCWWNGNDVHAQIEVLPTPSGNIAKALFQAGVPVGISSRGMGSVEENSDGVLMVQEDFDLLCFDLVSTPSTPGATLTPQQLKEGIIAPTQNYTKVHNIIRDIICDNTGVCKC